MNKIKKSIMIGVLLSIVLFFLFGIPTALISNPWFIRMLDKNIYDYFFLISSSILLGAYFSIYYYKKNLNKKCIGYCYSGGIGSFFAFGCPICNKLLVFLFGATALLNYFEPYRKFLGFLSIGVIILSLWYLIKNR